MLAQRKIFTCVDIYLALPVSFLWRERNIAHFSLDNEEQEVELDLTDYSPAQIPKQCHKQL